MPPKVLIVDDEAFIRTLIAQTLEDFEDDGVEILATGDGEEALRLIRSKKPDLVFLDVMLPNLDGFAVCQQVKENQTTAATYVVLLTAKGQEFDRLRGQQCGADQYLTKPFDPDEIVSLAEKILVH
ncbi:MAG TPA: response regulator [Anaerolineaceae bacterium]|nr:response regulator [Anaerolineaceae bacterium]